MSSAAQSTAAAAFIDAALQNEASWFSIDESAPAGLTFYGTSIGAIRGTVRAVADRYPQFDRDDITALSSELWHQPVFERRFAAIVLLQAHVRSLDNGDLTRLEGFARRTQMRALLDPLVSTVIRPLVEALSGTSRLRAESVLDRWLADGDPWLRRAALLTRDGPADPSTLE